MNEFSEGFKNLAATLTLHIEGRKVYYLANPGNWGDALIRIATINFFNNYHIDFKEIRLINRKHWLSVLFNKGSKVLIYGGGGGWCKNWEISYNIIKRKSFLFDKIIVLPSTYEHMYHLKKTIFFRRDQFDSKHHMPASYFCHDMAFYYKPKVGINTNVTEEANFFRTDKESAGIGFTKENNIDITIDKSYLDDIEPFVKIINNYRIINTDKLHVAILSLLLNKKVNFYSGNYFKNKAVFLSSMKGRFNNVRFVEWRKFQ